MHNEIKINNKFYMIKKMMKEYIKVKHFKLNNKCLVDSKRKEEKLKYNCKIKISI